MTSHGENGGMRNERTVSVFSANCEKKKRRRIAQGATLTWV